MARMLQRQQQFFCFGKVSAAKKKKKKKKKREREKGAYESWESISCCYTRVLTDVSLLST
ncbi:hypothetical protein L798_03726 [Zootermopsis nevadensis]|uniref:Uncharacterized protein n=1 Tax=Zootermopsis nevadensis TaxID=136037 RepID=A0A067RB14_ZOONE|nr:hypothetical protein L798_03726 [Zootermopsis nevadensis]